tara:strand:+ start:1312 stop:1491 length:180 start_codon:yes stop_codon:yes gene_type:complete
MIGEGELSLIYHLPRVREDHPAKAQAEAMSAKRGLCKDAAPVAFRRESNEVKAEIIDAN